MKEVIANGLKVPIKSWCSDIESEPLIQAHNLANLPFVFKHVALMPDCHKGYGMPIGGIIATKDVVVPNAVGADIGCGMCAVKTSLTSISKDELSSIVELIHERIPCGFNHHVAPQDIKLMPLVSGTNLSDFNFITLQEFESARYQIGTLGGGNHFIEIQRGNDGHIWIMIHSGSRNLGKKVADYYNNIAVKLNKQWYSSIEKSKELAFLPIQTDEAKKYIAEMEFCIRFAFLNRNLMMQRIIDLFSEVIPKSTVYPFNSNMFIDVEHNYARWENHFNSNVLVHRKGATSARLHEIGIIPGSQGTKSYIVEGLGNEQSFKSCSHGVGRKMGRAAATRTLNLEDEIRLMDEQGILHEMKNISDLDEASNAYKDIDVVMENQKDLVRILVELKPLAVIKG